MRRRAGHEAPARSLWVAASDVRSRLIGERRPHPKGQTCDHYTAAAMIAIREAIRRLELEHAWPWRSQRLHVLEIGGHNGLQARLLDEWGNQVVSVDVVLPPQKLHFPVTIYDGRNLPFPDHAFDVVYSSNVLEHLRPSVLSALLAETARVLRPGGTAMHILPSAAWRLWTIIAHYPWAALHLFGLRAREYPPSDAPAQKIGTVHRLLRRARNALIPPAHGVYPSAIAELYFYSRRRWRRVFESAGWHVESVRPAGVFYSGYKVTGLPLRTRSRLAPLLGSSCNVFTLRLESRPATPAA